MSDPTIAQIQRAVADYYGLPLIEMRSRRQGNATMARQIAMYIAKATTVHSLREIGELFGRRDRTTVRHGILRIDALCKRAPEMQRAIQQVRRALDNPQIAQAEDRFSYPDANQMALDI